MYDDNDRKVMDQIEQLLEVYDFEDILTDNDLSLTEALFILFENGQIHLPDTKPV